MKIIKNGNLDKLKNILTFTCNNCGCVFEADNTEYKQGYDWYNDTAWFIINCPCCERKVILDG